MTSQHLAVEEKIGYTFKNKGYLQLALTHKSADIKHNERLEFLGDAILSSVITSEIFKKFYDKDEGILSRIRSHLINKEKLIEVANRLDINEYIIISSTEQRRTKIIDGAILADSLEAIIGAIFLDCNWDTCADTVKKWYQTELSSPVLIQQDKDPKTKLQEYMQALTHPTPKYRVTETKGKEHAQTFVVSCAVIGIDLLTSGSGRTIKKAEQDAAEKFLNQLQEKEDI